MIDTVAPASVPALTSPLQAVQAMVERLKPVESEAVPLGRAAGRVLAQPLTADRPSPPCDASAMDGYAVRLGDLATRRLAVAATVLPGRPSPPMPRSAAIRIMTGAAVPQGADAVIRREDVQELGEFIELPAMLAPTAGQNIRRCGENLEQGGSVVGAGVAVTPALATALASFGQAIPHLFRRVRVAVIVTGDELVSAAEQARPWQIRDSNGPALEAFVSTVPWVEFSGRRRVADDPQSLWQAVVEQLSACDALLLTGGVSAGTHDFVPQVLRQAGCEVVFHKLPLRPGHPVLGAVGPGGQAVLGLPGNPQSVMTTARRLAAPALRRRAGFSEPVERRPVVSLSGDEGRTLGLWWYRPVRLTAAGQAELVWTRGSGDIVAAARSDGFIEVPPDARGAGPWPYYGWSLCNA